MAIIDADLHLSTISAPSEPVLPGYSASRRGMHSTWSGRTSRTQTRPTLTFKTEPIARVRERDSEATVVWLLRGG